MVKDAYVKKTMSQGWVFGWHKIFRVRKSKDKQVSREGDAHRSFRLKSVIHKVFVLQEQTVNGKFYVKFLEKLEKRVQCIRKEIFANWRLYNDNASSHTILIVTGNLTKHKEATTPAVLQPRCGTARLLFLFENKKGLEKQLFWNPG